MIIFFKTEMNVIKYMTKMITTDKFAMSYKLLTHPYSSETPGQESIPES